MATPRKRPEDKLKTGRPSKYKKIYCKKIIEWGEQGLFPIMWSKELMVSQATFGVWREAHPEFLDAWALAKDLANAHLTERAMDGDSLALAKTKFFLSACFGVSETQRQEVKKELTSHVKMEVDFGDRPDVDFGDQTM